MTAEFWLVYGPTAASHPNPEQAFNEEVAKAQAEKKKLRAMGDG